MRIKHWRQWVVIGVLAIPAAVVGGPYIYIHFVEGEAPPPLSITTKTPTADSSKSTTETLDGTWMVTTGSQAGYRVKEVLFGQDNEAVGRTTAIEGNLTISGATVEAATFTVDMTKVSSDQQRRDNQFQGRIMDTASNPTATFTLSEPIRLGTTPADGVSRTATATGRLTLRGTTKTVTFTVTGRRTGGTIQVSGTIPITFAEWNIPSPSFGPVSTEDHGSLEFLLTFSHA